jgi:hypothetical protein
MTDILKQSLPEKFKSKESCSSLHFQIMRSKNFEFVFHFQISILFQILLNGNKTIFYQRKIIQSEMTFEDYGITDYDQIVILSTDCVTFTIKQFWRKTTQRNIETKSQIQLLTNRALKNDIVFKNDLKMSKIENNSNI